MVQLWIDADPDADLMAVMRSRQPALRRMAVLDAVINNADRKGGHLLPLPDGHVYGVDHGVCFSVDTKLRTVLWQWKGRPLSREAVAVLVHLDQELERTTRAKIARTAHLRRGGGDLEPGTQTSGHRNPPLPLGRLARDPWPPI